MTCPDKHAAISLKLNITRKNILAIVALCLLTLTTGCVKQLELIFPKPVDSAMIGNIKTVVILGNSIVQYGPDPTLGWYGNWGLDASSKENDFVHILIRDLQLKNSNIIVKFRNIAAFEGDFINFPLASVDSLKNADLIIMKIAENVQSNGPQYDQFITCYDRLIHYLDPSNKAVKLIVDGFWDKDPVNNDIRNYAMDNKYPLVSITDLSEPKYKGLAGHPTDEGMRLIAERLWNYMQHYF